MLFLEYSKCSTSNKAKKWLKDNNIEVDKRSIKDKNPTFEELKLWYEKSGFDIKRFFNTGGKLYREQGIKDLFKTATITELLNILSVDGMMVKRPILISDDFILIGFKEELWESTILKTN